MCMCMVAQKRIHVHRILGDFPAKYAKYIHRIFMVLANPMYVCV
jgi:hypothetical protein